MREIEDNVPIPMMNRRGIPNGLTAVLRSMEVGQSFYEALNGRTPIHIQMSIASSAKHLRPKKFVTRTQEGGIRIWRIE